LGDNALTSTDAAIVLQTRIRAANAGDADINENGYVNVLDAIMVLQVAAGNIEW
jgi:hypothetical protein